MGDSQTIFKKRMVIPLYSEFSELFLVVSLGFNRSWNLLHNNLSFIEYVSDLKTGFLAVSGKEAF